MLTTSQAARHLALTLALLAITSCYEGDQPAASSEECAARGACKKSGRCTLDPKSKKCVVGSDADCARADICHVQQRCRKVGAACDQ